MKRVIIVCVMLLSGRLAAQHSLNLEQCLALALKNNPRILAAAQEIRAANFARAAISTTALPQFSFGIGGSYAPSSAHLGYDPVISNQGQLAGQVVLQQSVDDGGVRRIQSSQLDVNIQRAKKEREITNRDLRFAVTQSFVEILRAERETALQAASVEQLGEYLSLVQQLSHGGGASSTDVMKTSVQLANARLSLQKASESVASAKYTLAELIDQGIDTSFTVVGSLDSLALSLLDTTTQEMDLRDNLDLRVADLNLQTGLLDVDLARSERAPVVSLFADAGLLTSIQNLRLPAADRSSMIGYSVGISVKGLLSNWGGTALRSEQREAQVEFLRFQLDILHRSLLSDFKRTRLRLATAREGLQHIRANVALAEDTYLLTKSKYAGGGALSLEVLNAQQLLTATKLSEIQTFANIVNLSSRLNQLTTSR